MRNSGPGKLVRIYVGEEDDWHGQPLCNALVERARAEGLAGVTVIRGIEGYGASSQVHRATVIGFYDNLPTEIVVVDISERTELFLPLLDEMVTEGLITAQDCEVVKYVHAPSSESEL